MSNEKKVTSNITIEDAQLIFRNFSGKQTDFNDEGNRNFAVIIEDDDLAKELANDGWNIKRLKPRDDDPEGQTTAYLPVKVKYNKYPPVICLLTSKGKVKVDEETVGQLDWVAIENADLIIRPYNYPAMRGREAGVSAYLKTLYVTIQEDELTRKYADIPEVPYDGEED